MCTLVTRVQLKCSKYITFKNGQHLGLITTGNIYILRCLFLWREQANFEHFELILSTFYSIITPLVVLGFTQLAAALHSLVTAVQHTEYSNKQVIWPLDPQVSWLQSRNVSSSTTLDMDETLGQAINPSRHLFCFKTTLLHCLKVFLFILCFQCENIQTYKLLTIMYRQKINVTTVVARWFLHLSVKEIFIMLHMTDEQTHKHSHSSKLCWISPYKPLCKVLVDTA